MNFNGAKENLRRIVLGQLMNVFKRGRGGKQLRGQISNDRNLKSKKSLENMPTLVNLKSTANYQNADGNRDFDENNIPWIDRKNADIQNYLNKIKELPLSYDLEEKLIHWKKYGYVIFENAVDEFLIDAYLRDLEELFKNNHCYDVLVNSSPEGILPIRELSPDRVEQPYLRVLDFHNASTAGKKLALNKNTVSFLEHIFLDQVVAMQTLTFKRGSQQGPHQDYAYVVSGEPSYLAASWIALEDVEQNAGPLIYWPGSHRIQKFDFGNGLFLTPESKFREEHFQEHIEKECRRLGLQPEKFLGKKGDLFIWHAALVHGGTAIQNPEQTRLSLVTHYSSLKAYPRDRRNSTIIPKKYVYNRGIAYGDPLRPHLENIFLAGGQVAEISYLDDNAR